MDAISVTDKQKEQIRSVVSRLADDPDLTPQDFLDTWEAKPPVTNLEVQEHFHGSVPVDEIVGVAKQNTTRLVNRRLFNILRKIHDGEYTYEPPHDEPPHLEKIDGSYYVSNDGIHRTLAHKIVGLDEMCAEVHVYE